MCVDKNNKAGKKNDWSKQAIRRMVVVGVETLLTLISNFWTTKKLIYLGMENRRGFSSSPAGRSAARKAQQQHSLWTN